MLKLSQIKKHVYTHAEIIGNGYPEQWSKAKFTEESEEGIHCFARGIDFYLVQDLEAAIDDFTQAIIADGTLWLSYYARAVVRYKQMEMERANEGGGQQVATTPEDFMVDARLIQPHQAIC